MATTRIGTFNVDYLFTRYKFKKNIDSQKALIYGWRADQRHFDIYDDTSLKQFLRGSVLIGGKPSTTQGVCYAYNHSSQRPKDHSTQDL